MSFVTLNTIDKTNGSWYDRLMKNKIIAQILLFNWLLTMAFTWFTLYDPIPRGSATTIMEAGFWINLVFFVPLAGIRLLRSKS